MSAPTSDSPTTDRPLVLTAVGDIMMYGDLAEQMRRRQDMLWAFRPVLEELGKGDVLFGNLECPATRLGKPAANRPDRFGAPPGSVAALGQVGFDVVNLAHNHIYDFGAEGVELTLAELEQAGIQPLGLGRDFEQASRPCIVSSRQVKVGFLACTTCFNVVDESLDYTAAPADPQRLAGQIAELRRQVDLVVVSCHTGMQDCPYPLPETRQLAHALLDAGATLFLGHHPHVSQGIEPYGSGLIVYSLGDFVAPPRTDLTRRTFILHVELLGDRVTGFRQVPCFIDDQCRTTLARGDLARSMQQRLETLNAQVTDGQSDRLYYEYARKGFFSRYLPGLWREIRAAGPGILLRKFASMRRQHLLMLLNVLTFGLYKPRANRSGPAQERRP